MSKKKVQTYGLDAVVRTLKELIPVATGLGVYMSGAVAIVILSIQHGVSGTGAMFVAIVLLVPFFAVCFIVAFVWVVTRADFSPPVKKVEKKKARLYDHERYVGDI
jgi:hypothetical protein